MRANQLFLIRESSDENNSKDLEQISTHQTLTKMTNINWRTIAEPTWFGGRFGNSSFKVCSYFSLLVLMVLKASEKQLIHKKETKLINKFSFSLHLPFSETLYF